MWTNRQAHTPQLGGCATDRAFLTGLTAMSSSARNRPHRPDSTMVRTGPESSSGEGVLSLEVRWILPGRLDTAVDAWFGTSVPHLESREDTYLVNPDLGPLSVKIRAGRALEVKSFLGSPGILDVAGRARGRMQFWRKWSFPFPSGGQKPDSANDSGSWTRIGKQRKSIRFALTGKNIVAAAGLCDESAIEAWCAAELTEVSTEQGFWWSFGLEATGAGSLGTGLEATARMVLTPELPGGMEFRMAESMSYYDWLRSRSYPGS